MAVNVSVDAILGGIVQNVSAAVAPSQASLTADQPLRQLERYTGFEMSDEEAFRRGIAGRCPAARARFTGTKTLRTTMGRRVQRVESSFEVVLIDDSHEAKDRRQRLLAAGERIRHLATARTTGLAIEPLRYRDTRLVKDDVQCLAHALTFTAKHRVDYTINPGADLILTADGDIIAGDLSWRPSVVAVGTGGSTKYTYKVIPIDGTGARLLISVGTTIKSAAVLTGANYNALAWSPIDGAATYEVHRVESGGSPASLGLLGTVAVALFNDTGIAATTATPTAPFTQGIEVTF